MTEALPGPDGRPRTPWALANDRLLAYYDDEWGEPIVDEAGLFERLCLEAFQSGLSWDVILAKRPAFREVFHGFDPDAVAAMDDSAVESALADARIVRNRAKIDAAIGNARATVALRAATDDPPTRPEGLPAHAKDALRRAGLTLPDPGVACLIWSHLPETTTAPRTTDDVPATSPASAALAKALKKRGFRFVGPTTAHALMEAVGMVDGHLTGSWRRGCSGLWPEHPGLDTDDGARAGARAPS
ncbi:DNA-3-methyladenine glycosylase I [uncultured Corynebacterium sp.]|uniref:DNA-3-methyladenine glycosylase I n=1 Tax=uncultured Corynebacterium sp. TaxID=159447 RepID=UPI0025FA1E59|nr:DNA-3-methyladenine glycosylase I [uncultured Corynebacterium sp.]